MRWRKLVKAGKLKDHPRERIFIREELYCPTLYRERISGNVVWDGGSVSRRPQHEFIHVYHVMARQIRLMMAQGVWGEVARLAYINSSLWWEARDSWHPAFGGGELGTPWNSRTDRRWEKVGRLDQVIPDGLARWMIVDKDGKMQDIWPVCATTEEAMFRYWRHRLNFRGRPGNQDKMIMKAREDEYTAIPFDAVKYDAAQCHE